MTIFQPTTRLANRIALTGSIALKTRKKSSRAHEIDQLGAWDTRSNFPLVKLTTYFHEFSQYESIYDFFLSNMQYLFCNLFVTSKNGTTNSPIYEFKVLHKGQRAF